MEQAGHKCIGWVECDKAARTVYEAMHDTKGEWTENDIRNVTGSGIPAADIWCAGFPCNDVSKNGRQKGLAGEKSGLFREVIRIIREADEAQKPSRLLFENVENLLRVNKGWDIFRILNHLDEVGYDAEWQTITSTDCGIPQNRTRVFIVAHRRGRNTRRVFG
ncbi:DNA (cytosine-5-)-methyltransferase [Bacillus bombysepticus]|uniref:DNA cytosine methyltransferase n=1 Tax=Bacillus cereus TaxID=1396 RepID=UPI001FD18A42|nr:DNA (cytosine-5-)-methyltransferase [Bacillus cereus]MDM5370045.1 DNA (cytosine-5-)-methyltransferase [Bacillus bombysepticus]